jgi:ubiquinol-cytochrome c reductase cytochrome c1 subunit
MRTRKALAVIAFGLIFAGFGPARAQAQAPSPEAATANQSTADEGPGSEHTAAEAEVVERARTGEETEGAHGADWQAWHADNEVENLASLQRGARNFMGYCLGCHSLKYQRYSRTADDLQIPQEAFDKYLLPPGEKATNYILSSLPQADAEAWFGKAPPDLSLMARARGTDYIYQFLKTFYVDPTKTTGVNNLRLDTTAMPHVLSELEGLKQAVFKNGADRGAGADKPAADKRFVRFEQLAPGSLSEADYDRFVRDTVNFLDYVSEPAQVQRRALGVWVVLFLLLFTWLAWLLKKEYWKDVH